MDEALLDQASDFAFKKLDEFGGKLDELPLPLQTLIQIYSAQGIIDNGGLEYFYEMDFEGNPPYSVFVDAYQRIGANGVANCIEKTAAMFNLEVPHLQQPKRCDFLERVRNDENHAFTRLSNAACGDPDVMEKLSAYVDKNRRHFEG